MADVVLLIEFNALKATNREWRKFNKVRKLIVTEQTPNEEPESDEYFKSSLEEKYKRKDLKYNCYTINVEDNVIGYVDYNYWDQSSPSYAGNEKNVYYDLKMLQKYFTKERALKTLEQMVEKWSKIGKTIFITETESELANTFNTGIGSKKVMVITESKVQIEELEDNLLKEWIREGKEYNPTTEIKIFNNKIPDKYIEEYAKTFTEVGNDEPRGEQERGDEVFTVEYFRNQEEGAKKTGLKILNCCTIEEDGKISAFTKVKIIPGKERKIDQGLTGVIKRYRGRKLGKWVKATMIEYLMKNYPETKEIITGNADTNEAMLHINNALGFKKDKEVNIYQLTLQEVQKILG